MTACKAETEPVIEKEDVIELSDLQVNLGGDLKVGSTLSAQALWQGISVNLSINDGEKQRRTLEALFNEFKDKKTVAITITNNGNPIYTITNDNVPTKGYTFEAEINNFTVSVEIADYKIALSKTFTVEPKEQGQGGSEDPIVNPNPGKDPNEKPDDPKPPVTSTETLTKNFNSLRGLFEYAGQTISEGDQQTGTITLTAQTIKKLATLPSDLKIEVPNVPTDTTEEEKEAKRKAAALAEYEKYKDLSNLVNAYDNKEIVVEKGEDVTLPTYRYDGFPTEDKKVPQYVISSDKTISLKDNFYYTDMALDISNLTNVNVDNATFSMGEDNSNYEVFVDMIESLYKSLNPNVTLDSDEILRSNENNNFNDYKTPKLDFNLNSIDFSDDLKNLTSLYKIYDKKNKLDDIKIDYYDNNILFDGNESKKEKILFDGNKLTEVVPNVSIDVFLKLTKLSKHKELKNLVITGSYTGEEQDINSEITNVVFTGDVSGLKNSAEYQFNGVVYFMDKPYNNRRGDTVGDYIRGLLKLDKLEGVSYDTFRVDYGVLDLRGRDGFEHNPLEGCNIETDSEKSINQYGHKAIYFTEKYVEKIENIDQTSSIEKKFETLTRRVHRVGEGGEGGEGVYNVYVDNNKYDSIADTITPSLKNYDYHALSKTPRTLEEFEYYGDNGKFKTPAYDSYNGNFTDVHPDVIEKLKKDKESGAYQLP